MAWRETSTPIIEQIREAFAAYRRAEGCQCCRDEKEHIEATMKLAELLEIPKGYDFELIPLEEVKWEYLDKNLGLWQRAGKEKP